MESSIIIIEFVPVPEIEIALPWGEVWRAHLE